jgi:hypothetical protein
MDGQFNYALDWGCKLRNRAAVRLRPVDRQIDGTCGDKE